MNPKLNILKTKDCILTLNPHAWAWSAWGGSIMVWAGFAAFDPGQLAIIDGPYLQVYIVQVFYLHKHVFI